jgi:hypothetical protein
MIPCIVSTVEEDLDLAGTIISMTCQGTRTSVCGMSRVPANN